MQNMEEVSLLLDHLDHHGDHLDHPDHHGDHLYHYGRHLYHHGGFLDITFMISWSQIQDSSFQW